jgi:hypothetical protein
MLNYVEMIQDVTKKRQQ